MTADIFTRLSGTTGSAAAGQNIASTTTAGVYSTNWFDLDAAGSLRTQRDLRDLFAVVWTTGTLVSATLTATIDIEIVMCPTTTPATPTFTFTTLTFAADDRLTAVAHGMPNGTRLVLTTATTLPAGLALATSYFVRDATADTFNVSLTPGGAVVAVTDAGTGVHTATWHAEVVGGATKVALQRMIANVGQAQPRINPLLLGPGNGVPVHRYLFARYTPSVALTAASQPIFCDIRSGAPMRNFPINPNNYVTP